MKKRSIIFLSLILALVMFLSVGCGAKSPKEILEEAVINSAKITTSQQKIELDLSLDIENPDPMMAGYLQMLQDVSLEIDIKSDTESMMSEGKFTVDLNGMAYTVDVYVTPEHVALRIPITPQYVVQEIEEDMEMDEDDKKEMLDFVAEISKTMLDNIEDDKIINNGKKDIATPQGDLKVTEIAVEMSDAEIKEIMEQVVDIMFENSWMREYMVQGVKTALESEDEVITDESIEAKLAEIKSEIDIAFDEMNEVLQINGLNMTYFIDSKNNLRKTDFEFTVAIEDEETEQNITVEFKGTTDVWNINEDLEMDIPEINEDNSISMEELINQMFGIMPY